MNVIPFSPGWCWRFVLVVVLLLVPWGAGSARAAADPVAAYQSLFAQVETRGPAAVWQERERWPDSPFLASYLEMELLLHPHARVTIPWLKDFLRRHPEHAHANRVRRLLDSRMVAEGADGETWAWIKDRPSWFDRMRRRKVELALKNAAPAVALDEWRALYMSGVELPATLQERVVAAGFKPTVAEVESRARALISRKERTQLKKTIRLLHRDRQTWFLALDAARHGEKSFESLLRQLPAALAADSELWQERILGLRRHGFRDKALALLTGAEGRRLSETHGDAVRIQLARDALFDAVPGEPARAWSLLEPLLAAPNPKREEGLWLAGWAAWRLGHLDDALRAFSALHDHAESFRRKAQGAFWAGRVLERQGQDPRPWWHKAAQIPHDFYGLLALEKLQGGLTSLPGADLTCGDFSQRPAVGRVLYHIKLLGAVGRGYYGREEIDAVGEREKLTPAERLCMALSHQVPDRAIQAAGQLLFSGPKQVYWQGLYPDAPWQPRTGWQVDPALVWGIVRQESLMFHRIESRAHAVGLMQLLPATAQEEARRIGLPESDAFRLQQTGYNLALGQSYVRRQLEVLGGDLVLALAAYNAGPSRAKAWRERRAQMDPVDFIESIPFNETREYVKRVSHGVAVYQVRRQGKSSLAALVAPGGPGMAALLPPPGGR
ncbi:MAG: lytic transglycosylase domain-containing protein [Magnetococcus sp. WYHC-3]